MAAGILKRLADMDENREKNLAAKSKLKLTVAPAQPVIEEPLSIANPLASVKKLAPTFWIRKSDGEDVWFVNISTGESQWTLPEGGVLDKTSDSSTR